MFERGLTSGSSGNISVKLDDGWLVTPTNACLGFLDAIRLSRLNGDWDLISGDPPTKELPLHRAFYDARPNANAIIHLHSTYGTAVSCLADIDVDDAIPAITPYVVMRVGRVPVVPYTMPGSADVAPLIADRASKNPAILLGNHGPVVAGVSLEAAVYAIEELEAAARLHMLTRGVNTRHLTPAEVAALRATFPIA